MSSWSQIYCNLLRLPLKLLVRSKSIPINPVSELGLDISRPIIYVLPYNSKTDLLTLRSQGLIHDLPDPLEPIVIGNNELPRCIFIHEKSHPFHCYMPKEESVKLFHDYLNLHYQNLELDIQLVPVFIMFGRSPGREKRNTSPTLRMMLNSMQKFLAIIWLGRDSFVRFSPSISLRQMAMEHGMDKNIAQKLARIARIHFARQYLAAVGPRLPIRQDLFNKLLTSRSIIRAVEDESRSKKISYKEAQKNAIDLMKEIAANFSYEMIRLTDRILGLTWNCLYQGINVYNAERVRQLAYEGHRVVYIPCHRSHMDYLLLSYILYHHGLVPPHIAAGINLNFWPVGPVFRRLGAFFIRRTFKNNKLYSTVFREYLEELFSRGYSIEYFIEGGRSRTGRLLDPKTGTLSLTIQVMLRKCNSPISLVPVYIGYENVLEVKSYTEELRGAIKDKENILQMLRGLSKLRNLGYGDVNFGKPLTLMTWLNQHVPKWRESIDLIEVVRPTWLTPAVNSIAADLMIRINKASAVNAMNLCCTALLASNKLSLTREQLTEQLECYLGLMRNVPYADDSVVPSVTVDRLIDHALRMNTFEVKKNNIGDIIILPRDQAMIMNYYRNNIIHMIVLPSLMAAIIIQYHYLSSLELLRKIEIFYPLLRTELFLCWKSDELALELDKLTNELQRQSLITLSKNKLIINPLRSNTLHLLAASVNEILQRYAIIFWLLSTNPFINRNSLERKSCMLTQHLSMLHNINTLECFDKSIFSNIMLTLRDEGYISDTRGAELKRITKVYQILAKLIIPDIRLTIESTRG